MSMPAAHRNRNRLPQDPLHAIPLDHFRGERPIPTVDLGELTFRLARKQGGATAVKVVAVPKPDCPVPGLPGTTLLMDEETGSVRAVVNSAELTGIRTAYDALSLLCYATVKCADTDAIISWQDCVRPRHQTPRRSDLAGSRRFRIRSPGIPSCSYARLVFSKREMNFRLLMFSRAGLILELFPSVTKLKLVVRSRGTRANTLAKDIAALFPRVTVTLETSEEEAVAAAVQTADIICTCVSLPTSFSLSSLRKRFLTNKLLSSCVPSTTPLFKADSIKPGAHINASKSLSPENNTVSPSSD